MSEYLMEKVYKNHHSSKKLVCLCVFSYLLMLLCEYLQGENFYTSMIWFHSKTFAVKVLIFQHTYLEK